MIIEQFLDYLRYERNKSPLTAKNYGRDLHDFESYIKGLDDHLSLEMADADLIRGWMESMMDKGNSTTSVNRRLSALRSFFRYALSRDLVKSDPSRTVKGPKNGKTLPLFIRECEINRILDTELDKEHFKDVRARTIIMMFYETGVRLSELVGMDDTSIDTTNRVIRVTGKGDKQRLIPYGNELANMLNVYKETRGKSIKQKGPAMFVGENGQRLNADQVRYIVRRELSKVTTLKKKSPHVLRHTFATAMLNHGAGIESIKMLLGHEKVETTEIYTHTTFEQLKRVYKQAHPRA